jgi:phosphoribosylanthranilate isomerase
VTEIKICGIRDAVGMDAVAAAGADYVGFVFFEQSPRNIHPETAAALASRHPGGPRSVALLVEPTDHDVEALLSVFRPDILQVHASATCAAAIQEKFGVPVWHVVGVATAADLPAAAPGITRLLLDRKPQATDTRPGGNAQSFDWSALRDWCAPKPWVLAGGLSPCNVAAAIRQTAAPTVDVSSGVERARGIKDPTLIAAFISAVREQDRSLGRTTS